MRRCARWRNWHRSRLSWCIPARLAAIALRRRLLCFSRVRRHSPLVVSLIARANRWIRGLASVWMREAWSPVVLFWGLDALAAVVRRLLVQVLAISGVWVWHHCASLLSRGMWHHAAVLWVHRGHHAAVLLRLHLRHHATVLLCLHLRNHALVLLLNPSLMRHGGCNHASVWLLRGRWW